MPTLWLMPIVLACGALRFRPLLQVMMGIVLIVGFAFILTHPAASHKEVSVETFDFFFALPPNVMRLTMMGIAVGVLVMATVRTRALFWRAITDANARANLTRYLPEQLVDQLAKGDLDALRSGSRIDAAILFADMRGFTQMSEQMDPSDLSVFMSEFRAHVSVAAAQSDGIIDKFMGDAVLIVFPDAAPQALECATRLQDAVTRWSNKRLDQGLQSVSVGIGLHFGRVFSGVVGDQSRLEYSVFGDAVNVAARLEALTKDKGRSVLASHDFVERTQQPEAAWEYLAEETLRGRAEVISVYALR
jgi:adenylate cyclase